MRSAAARIHEVCEPAEPARRVDARRTLVVRLGLRTNLVHYVPRQRRRVGKPVDKDNAGEDGLTELRVGRFVFQLFFIRERCNNCECMTKPPLP